MAPPVAQILLSPAELAYLHSSLSLNPPIRPDSRLPTQFRPLVAETEILPGTNGSARICFADGTEAIVGIKAEVEKTASKRRVIIERGDPPQDEEMHDVEERGQTIQGKKGAGQKGWIEMTIEIPGHRDDDPLPVFLAAMLGEALLATGELVDKLWLNRLWHWKLYIDILLLSPPLSYPVPLLSLTTHLALLSTRLPALKSSHDEDPLFNDDWDAAVPLYPPSKPETQSSRPPVTLLIIAVGPNIFFDPTREELAVADAVLAVSLTTCPFINSKDKAALQLLSLRTIDPPSRLTSPGVPDKLNPATGAVKTVGNGDADEEGVWRPPRGGMKRELVGRVLEACLEKEGAGEEVMAGLAAVDLGWTS